MSAVVGSPVEYDNWAKDVAEESPRGGTDMKSDGREAFRQTSDFCSVVERAKAAGFTLGDNIVEKDFGSWDPTVVYSIVKFNEDDKIHIQTVCEYNQKAKHERPSVFLETLAANWQVEKHFQPPQPYTAAQSRPDFWSMTDSGQMSSRSS